MKIYATHWAHKDHESGTNIGAARAFLKKHKRKRSIEFDGLYDTCNNRITDQAMRMAFSRASGLSKINIRTLTNKSGVTTITFKDFFHAGGKVLCLEARTARIVL